MIVADSSPLIGLAVIGQLDALRIVSTRVLAPQAVWAEIMAKGGVLPGAREVGACKWIEVLAVDANRVAPLIPLVEEGEAEAIVLAQTVPASTLLIDEKKGRRLAKRMQVPLIGTIGILQKAKSVGAIPKLRPCLDQLRAHGMYLKQDFVNSVLRSVGEA